MKLLRLAAIICNSFSSNTLGAFRTVQKVKDNEVRDVVTTLDQILHEKAEHFILTSMPSCKLMSEEGEIVCRRAPSLSEGEWLVVDPLDGSNNYALSLPGYGFMAAHVVHSQVKGSVVVLPEHDIYFVVEDGEMVISQPFEREHCADSASVYPPKLSMSAIESRSQLIDLIDRSSSGVYRYGSSCIGLYNLIRGNHVAFIGHGIRIWDALAFFPILERFGIYVNYHINESSLVLVASSDKYFVNEACGIITKNEMIKFNSFKCELNLQVST